MNSQIYIKLRIQSWRSEIQHGARNLDSVWNNNFFLSGKDVVNESEIYNCIINFSLSAGSKIPKPSVDLSTRKITLHYPYEMYGPILYFTKTAAELYLVYYERDNGEIDAFLHNSDEVRP